MPSEKVGGAVSHGIASAQGPVSNSQSQNTIASPETPGLSTYIEVISQIERMHRLLLDVIKDEFTRAKIFEINPVQGLLLYNISLSELSAGELRSKGYYQGSNVSYNLKKLVEGEYIHYERNTSDRRAVRIRLTAKGRGVHDILQELFRKNYEDIIDREFWTLSDCKLTRDNLVLLERFWSDQIRFIY